VRGEKQPNYDEEKREIDYKAWGAKILRKREFCPNHSSKRLAGSLSPRRETLEASHDGKTQ